MTGIGGTVIGICNHVSTELHYDRDWGNSHWYLQSCIHRTTVCQGLGEQSLVSAIMYPNYYIMTGIGIVLALGGGSCPSLFYS